MGILASRADEINQRPTKRRARCPSWVIFVPGPAGQQTQPCPLRLKTEVKSGAGNSDNRWAGFVIAFGNFEGTFYRYAKRYEEKQAWQPPPSKAIKKKD